MAQHRAPHARSLDLSAAPLVLLSPSPPACMWCMTVVQATLCHTCCTIKSCGGRHSNRGSQVEIARISHRKKCENRNFHTFLPNIASGGLRLKKWAVRPGLSHHFSRSDVLGGGERGTHSCGTPHAAPSQPPNRTTPPYTRHTLLALPAYLSSTDPYSEE
jgi:hypothetical protein